MASCSRSLPLSSSTSPGFPPRPLEGQAIPKGKRPRGAESGCGAGSGRGAGSGLGVGVREGGEVQEAGEVWEGGGVRIGCGSRRGGWSRAGRSPGGGRGLKRSGSGRGAESRRGAGSGRGCRILTYLPLHPPYPPILCPYPAFLVLPPPCLQPPPTSPSILLHPTTSFEVLPTLTSPQGCEKLDPDRTSDFWFSFRRTNHGLEPNLSRT